MALDKDGFVVAKSQRVIDRTALNLSRTLKPLNFFTWEELQAVPPGSVFHFDSECYPNMWLLMFMCDKTDKIVSFEISPANELNINLLRWMLWRYTIIGFNSRKYDAPMISYAMTGVNAEQLKGANDFLILSTQDDFGREKAATTWDFEQKYKLIVEQYNQIDMIEVAPLQGSLKLYAARLHCQRMQDLPYSPDHWLSEQEAEIVRMYCGNDLANNKLLYRNLLPQLDLRAELGREYDLDLRSKSDAQLAEAVINSELKKLIGYWPKKPELAHGIKLKYNIPTFIQYQSPVLNKMLDDLREAEFALDGQGSPMWPQGLGELEKSSTSKMIWQLKVKIGENIYKMGMGGLHSQEKSISHYATPDLIIEDDDFDSFYPWIIIHQRLFPEHLGEPFLIVYEKIVRTRMHAKGMAKKCKECGDKEGEKRWKVIADSLKITINGSFGKLGNKYSTIYAPQLMLQVTITGQLVLLMLIEQLELNGIKCISANTDGVVSIFHPNQNKLKRDIIRKIELITNFTTEATRYASTHNRDVNNYLALKLKQKDGEWTNEIEEVKVKGIYSERGSALNSVLSKNPETLICSDALQQFLKSGIPIEKTISECKDIRRFVAVKNVKGGGAKDGIYLGKVVRWYYAQGEHGFIEYAGSGNKVPKSDGAKPLMDLPDEFPQDINYNWYIKETREMLFDIGVLQKPTTMPLFF